MRIIKFFFLMIFVFLSFLGNTQKLSPKQRVLRTKSLAIDKEKSDSLILAATKFEKANRLFELGNLNVELKNYKEAIANFSESLENSIVDEVYLERGMAYDAIGESENAINDLNQHLRKSGDKPIGINTYRWIYFIKAFNYIKLNNYESALSEYNHYLKLNDSDGLMLVQRGGCLLRMERNVEAIQDFTKAINLPLSETYDLERKIPAYVMRASAKEKLGDNFGSLRDIDIALELGEKSISPFVIRGRIMLKQKSFNSAIANFKIALEMDNNNTDVLFLIAKAKLLNGDVKSACFDLSHLGELGVKEAYDLINKYCN